MAGGGSQDWYRLCPEWADRVVEAADIRSGGLVIELGAGDGALTDPLARTGARVIAVEVHPGRAGRLRDRVRDLDVRVVEMDATDFRYPGRRARVEANPPFGIVSGLIRSALGQPGVLALDLVLPRSVALRWADGRLRAARRFRGRLGPVVPRRAFSPAPRVDCAVLHLCRRRG